MKYLLGIDFGGGASKATLIDEIGNIVSENSVEYPTYHPQLNACEQNPNDWLSALCENTNTILKDSKIAANDIAAVAIDSATHTSVVCDANFKPLRNAIHWTDTRSRNQANKLLNSNYEFIFNKMFHSPSTIWTLPQLLWIKENEPELFKQIKYIFFEKDYIRFFLTNIYCTDYIEAQGSMLFNYNSNEWDSELCDFCGLKKDILPPIKKPTDVIGTVTNEAAQKTGLFPGTPVICGTTDTCMEILASGAINKKDITIKLATAGRICIITDKPYPDTHIINYSHINEGFWYPGTATKAAASSLRWYRDTFNGDYKELDTSAEKIALGSDGLMFHPYINGELTPYADPDLCGSFTGIRSTHTKAHFSRAVLEGVAFSLLDNKQYIDKLNIPYNSTATLIGGGAKSKLWRQITADILGISLCTTKSSDSSLGSAMLAGISVGIFADAQDAVNKCVKVDSITHPNKDNTKKYSELFAKYKKIHDALAPIYKENNV